MNQVNKRHLPLSGAYNFRDLGGYRTHTGEMTKWRRILRADCPHRLSSDDISKLMGEGLTTVIDLRSNNETENNVNPFATMTGVAYQNVGLFDHLAPDTMHDEKSQPEADPLFGFYVKTLANRQTAIRNVLSAIANAQDGMVMFHCTAGKDRTGLISALLLGLAEVEESEIVSDYAQTKLLIADLVLEFLELAKENGTNLANYRRLLDCKPETMRNVVGHINDSYQSVPGYAAEIGLQPELITRLSSRLLV